MDVIYVLVVFVTVGLNPVEIEERAYATLSACTQAGFTEQVARVVNRRVINWSCEKRNRTVL